MKTKERIERAGWQYKEVYAYLEIYYRNDERLLYDPKKDEVTLVYGEGVTPYKPGELDMELLCQDFKVKQFVSDNIAVVKRKMIYAHFYGGSNERET